MELAVETYQPEAVGSIRRALARGRLPHGLILASPGDVGESEIAAALAQSLLCEAAPADLTPCGACSSCHLFRAGSHPEYQEVRPKGFMRAIKTDDMLSMIQSLQATALMRGTKVGVIYQAETLRKEGANRFLKTLEEPTQGTYFIIVTTRPERLLPTIKSRCQIIRLQPLSDAALRERVAREFKLAGADLDLVCALARGRWRKARQLAEGLPAYREMVTALARMLANRACPAATAVAWAQATAQETRARRDAFEERCDDELAAKTKELSDLEPKIRREMLDALREELTSEQAALERDEKASMFEALIELWRDVLVLQWTRDERLLLHRFLAATLGQLAAAYSEQEILRNLADIELVRGPAVYLNMRMNFILQGVLAQATQPIAERVPLRAAIAASGL